MYQKAVWPITMTICLFLAKGNVAIFNSNLNTKKAFTSFMVSFRHTSGDPVAIKYKVFGHNIGYNSTNARYVLNTRFCICLDSGG